MPKVSIIVPVYGVEKYIQRCAESLFKQSLEDLEFIFVDDCTKDNSLSVLEKVLDCYPNRKQQVKIISHTINKGLPLARKSGIEAASGDFILNCDSDDWLDVDMAKKMYEAAINEGSDVVICDFAVGSEIRLSKKVGCINAQKEQIIKDMCSMRIPWSVCNKLFKKDLFNSGIEYPTGNMGEDMALTMQLILKANQTSYLSESLYYYFINPESITQMVDCESIKKKYEQYHSNVCIVLSLFQQMGLEKSFRKSLDVIKMQNKRVLWGAGRDPQLHTIWLKTFPELNKRILFNNYISFKEKIKYCLCLLNLYPC